MTLLTPTTPPDVGVRHKQDNTTAYVNESCLGNGTLFVAESLTVWIQEGSGLGFGVEYPTVTMHAISRDRSSFDSDCLFAVLDVALQGTSTGTGTGESDYAASTEIRFIPLDVSSLSQQISKLPDSYWLTVYCGIVQANDIPYDHFKYCSGQLYPATLDITDFDLQIDSAMSACQRLHPDQQSSDEGEYNNAEDCDDQDELEFNGLPEADRVIYQQTRVNGSIVLHEQNAAMLSNAINQLTTNENEETAMDAAESDQQFEDAD